ncbi:MAG: phosphodiester glycosidase family protein [Acidobacteriota bacterium]
MKRYSSLLLLVLTLGFVYNVHAYTPYSTTIVAPGVIHSQYNLPGPFTLDVLEVDLKNPYIMVESYKPAGGLTKTTVQCAANDRENHRVIGGVNADFFSFETGWPIGNQVVNGKPAQALAASHTALGITASGKPLMEKFSFTGKVIAKSGAAATINGVNTTRSAASTVLFTSFEGASTGTDNSGVEYVLSLASPKWIANDTLKFVVTAKASGGNSAIPANGAVLSAGSTAGAFLAANVAVNDTIRIYMGFGVPAQKLAQIIAGNGRILRNGVNVSPTEGYQESGQSFCDARHPRTFVGFNADSSKLFLCTVDGRQASSLGMSFNEMASFLLTLNVTDAFNFDGGGSTTMVVRGKVVNDPSDPGGERSVANTLQVVSIAPQGALTSLNIMETRADVFQGSTFQFHAEGKDEYYNPLSLPSNVTWEADANIGTIDANGLFTSKSVNDSGWVRIRYNKAADSVRVFVRVIKELRAYPQTLVMVPGERLTLSVKGTDSGNNKVTMNNTQVAFVNNADGLNVDADGVVTATAFGSGTLTVKLDTVTRVIAYTSVGTDTTIMVETFKDTYAWTWDVAGTDPDNVTFGLSSDALVTDAPAFKLGYAVSASGATAVLNTTMPLSSRVDSIFVRVYGDGGGHKLKLTFADKEGQLFTISSPTVVNWKNEWRTVGFKMVYAVPVNGGTVDYPITITQIETAFGMLNQSGGKATGTIYIDDVKAHYPNRTVAPSILFNFNSDMSGWQQPSSNSASAMIGVIQAQCVHAWSTEHPYEGDGCGKWTFVDDPAKTVDWNVRITRLTSAELGSMLRGSYIGAWVWANGQTNLTLRTVIRDGNGQICAGPAFPVNHYGWKLIGTKLDSNLFKPYLTAGKITDTGNKFNGFNVLALNADVQGGTRVLYIDKMVTSALTVPTGFIDYKATFNGTLARLTWTVNSEISIDRYTIERGVNGTFSEIGAMNAVGNTDTTQTYEYVDTPPSGKTYEYRIRQITNDGAQEVSPALTLNTTTGVAGESGTPFTYGLSQNYPNPFNPATRMQYSLPSAQRVTLKIYDVLGRVVTTLVNDVRPAGMHEAEWNASNVSSGIYFYELRAGDFRSVKKLVVQK